jgi:predicted CoA-binding protein
MGNQGLYRGRPEVNGDMIQRFTTVDSSKEVVVVVCPYSTGCVIVQEIQRRGYKVIALWPKGFSEEMKSHVPVSCGTMQYYAVVTVGDDSGETSRELYKAAGAFKIVGCICGGEAGVDLADVMSELLLVRTNGAALNRRNKRVQQEVIKAAGLRSVHQCSGKVFSDVEAYLKREDYPLVLKPTASAGSDNVKLCHDFEEAKVHFEHILASVPVNGGQHSEVLCQEFLQGKEYVIDTVSRDGEHKTMSLWVYDKRPANGSFCVYFGMLPIDSASPEAKELIPYCNSVLDVLGMKNGPSHAEVILTPSGPCLVEMNCRAHGGNGNWRLLSKAFNGGYSQVEATVDAYFDKKAFEILPMIPPSNPTKAFGQEVIMVSYAQGEVVSTPGYYVIKQLDSFVYLETGISVGSKVEHTVDLVTSVGSVILLNTDKEVLKQDVEKIRDMEKKNELFMLT